MTTTTATKLRSWLFADEQEAVRQALGPRAEEAELEVGRCICASSEVTLRRFAPAVTEKTRDANGNQVHRLPTQEHIIAELIPEAVRYTETHPVSTRPSPRDEGLMAVLIAAAAGIVVRGLNREDGVRPADLRSGTGHPLNTQTFA